MVPLKINLPLKILLSILIFINAAVFLTAEPGNEFYLKGIFYQDWMGLKGDNADMYNRISSRFRLTFWNKPGDGWTGDFDLRNRFTFNNKGGNQLIIYDAKVIFDSLKSKFFLSLGQMNLYDTAGIGELAGILGGYKPFKNILVGGYYGIEPDLYNSRLDSGYKKYGGFVKYSGPGAKLVSLSFNHLSYEGMEERIYLHSSLYLPYKRLLFLFGTAEYELADNITKEDRLSRLFFNIRLNISKKINITGSYSSGRGLDYHRFLVEKDENKVLPLSEIERFYYNKIFGIRLTFKPVKNLRLSFSRKESERIDEEIQNHTNRFSLSYLNILRSGVSFTANYNMNRGENSESDSYYISTSRNFGRLNANISFSSYFNSLYILDKGFPEITYIPDRRTISVSLFYIFNRYIAVSTEYAYLFQDNYRENRVFVRLILRK